MGRYKIWKKSIEEYNIQDTETGEITVMNNFILWGVTFHVDLEAYERAKELNFKNSGETEDYFAWMEADEVYEGDNYLDYNDTVWYNPFKHTHFRDRTTGKVINESTSVVVKKNLLTY